MADAADNACLHVITGLHNNHAHSTLEWACSDCGRVFHTIAYATIDQVGIPGMRAWAARVGIPDRAVTRWADTHQPVA